MASTYELVSCKGHKLHCEEHLPAGQVKAVLVWHHGLGDHIARYTRFFQKATEEGIAVYTFDAHSHGKSGPEMRCMIHNFDDLIDDVYLNVEEIKKKQAGSPPMFVGGQSMGGLVATHVALRQPDIWSGLILNSAAIDVIWTPVLRMQAAIGNVLAALVPKAQLVPAVTAEHMSQDPAVVKAFLDDPQIFHGNVRAKTANQILKGMQRLVPLEARLTLPILAVHGTDDKTTALPAVKRLFASAASTDKTLKEIPGGYHELLLGPEKEEVISTVTSWIVQHATGAVATAGATADAAEAAPAQAVAAAEAAPAEAAADATSEEASKL